jgi:hypothetical protein
MYYEDQKQKSGVITLSAVVTLHARPVLLLRAVAAEVTG